MNTLPSLLFIGLCCILSMCSASRKEQDRESMAPSDPEITSPEEDTAGPTPSVSIAPGTARVIADIVEADLSDDMYLCILKINTVQGYGAGTPPLAVGSEIRVLIHADMVGNLKPAESAETLLDAGSTLQLTLKYSSASELTGAGAPSWRALSIRK